MSKYRYTLSYALCYNCFPFIYHPSAFSCSSVEQPGVVFSVEQVHCDRSEANSPALSPAESDTTLKSDSDGKTPGKVENVGSSPSNSAELFFELKEKPEELLQLAPEAGDVVPLTGKTLQRLVCVFYLFIFYSLNRLHTEKDNVLLYGIFYGAFVSPSWK